MTLTLTPLQRRHPGMSATSSCARQAGRADLARPCKYSLALSGVADQLQHPAVACDGTEVGFDAGALQDVRAWGVEDAPGLVYSTVLSFRSLSFISHTRVYFHSPCLLGPLPRFLLAAPEVRSTPSTAAQCSRPRTPSSRCSSAPSSTNSKD